MWSGRSGLYGVVSQGVICVQSKGSQWVWSHAGARTDKGFWLNWHSAFFILYICCWPVCRAVALSQCQINLRPGLNSHLFSTILCEIQTPNWIFDGVLPLQICWKCPVVRLYEGLLFICQYFCWSYCSVITCTWQFWEHNRKCNVWPLKNTFQPHWTAKSSVYNWHTNMKVIAKDEYRGWTAFTLKSWKYKFFDFCRPCIMRVISLNPLNIILDLLVCWKLAIEVFSIFTIMKKKYT